MLSFARISLQIRRKSNMKVRASDKKFIQAGVVFFILKHLFLLCIQFDVIVYACRALDICASVRLTCEWVILESIRCLPDLPALYLAPWPCTDARLPNDSHDGDTPLAEFLPLYVHDVSFLMKTSSAS